MIRSPFRIARLDLPLDASFDRLLRAEAGVQLQVQPANGDPDAIWAMLSEAHAYHVSSAKNELPQQWFVDASLLARCPGLVCVSTYGAGYDTVDVAACTRAGVCVVNQAGSNAQAVAEHAFAFLLALARHLPACDRALRRGDKFQRHAFIGRDLQDMTLGIVGIGHTGSRVARLAAAFGMKTVATDPGLSPQQIAGRGAQPLPLPDLLPSVDVVSLHCPLDATTAGMMGAAEFAAMKPGSIFISTARGGIHDEAALHAALASGHLAGAGLDVWESEPPPMSHPLLALPNVIATHHIAGVTHGARAEMARMGARQLLAVSHGERPANLLNPEAWPACASRLAGMTGASRPAP